MVVEVALNYTPQPLPEFCHGLVPTSSKFLPQLFKLCKEAFPDGLT